MLSKKTEKDLKELKEEVKKTHYDYEKWLSINSKTIDFSKEEIDEDGWWIIK